VHCICYARAHKSNQLVPHIAIRGIIVTNHFLVLVHDDELDTPTNQFFFLSFSCIFCASPISGLHDVFFYDFTRTFLKKKVLIQTLSAHQTLVTVTPWIGFHHPSDISRLADVFHAMQILAQNSAPHFPARNSLIAFLDPLSFKFHPKEVVPQ
jgi:hypothetical protein